MSIGERIQECRKRAGLKQKELAQKIGVTSAAISQFESGKATPRNETLEKIATVLNTDYYYLIGGFTHEEMQRIADGQRAVFYLIREIYNQELIDIDDEMRGENITTVYSNSGSFQLSDSDFSTIHNALRSFIPTLVESILATRENQKHESKFQALVLDVYWRLRQDGHIKEDDLRYQYSCGDDCLADDDIDRAIDLGMEMFNRFGNQQENITDTADEA